MEEKNSFEFLDYSFDKKNYEALFRYKGLGGIIFTEKVKFKNMMANFDMEALDRALFLCFILIGTSYYKLNPIKNITLKKGIDQYQAEFFNTVYRNGLSQFIFENELDPDDMAEFKPSVISNRIVSDDSYSRDDFKVLSLQSGGKDSLLTAELLNQAGINFDSYYIASSNNYPKILNDLPHDNLIVNIREIDKEGLIRGGKMGGLNGHVPITYIVQSLALVQAILSGKNTILVSIGQEGNESHAKFKNLPINHQWSKTWKAEQLFADYVKNYISTDINIGSPLRGFTELKIAELFVKNCWEKYGHKFSSCNNANYKQGNNNSELKWCGDCPKCANSYLLFAPFLDKSELDSIFKAKNPFNNPDLLNDYRGLLGIDGVMKPFECVGEIDELRKAFHMIPSSYKKPDLIVAQSNFDKERNAPVQPFIKKLFAK